MKRPKKTNENRKYKLIILRINKEKKASNYFIFNHKIDYSFRKPF